MFVSRIRAATLAIAAGLSLSACVYDDGYGYGGLSVGYGSAGYYDGYYDPYYGGHYGRSSYGYAPYWGWYNGYYYPGTGYYVYDSYRRPHRWNDHQQRYWVDRQRTFRNYGNRQEYRELRDNWRDFRQDRRRDDREFRQDRRGLRQDFRQGELTREQFREQRRDLRRGYRQELRQDRRELRRENRGDRRGRRGRP
jgi:hypothetical protein